ncbi:MAG: trypsin-like peptidase domain-containing protein [Pirellulales bacterium]
MSDASSFSPLGAYPPPQPAPPPASSRLPILLVILAALAFVVVLPYAAEQVQYALKRGELKARAEAAAAEIAELSKNAELVKLSDTSCAFRAVAQLVEPSVVHINTESIKVVRQEMQDEWGLRVPYGRGQRMRGQGSGVIVDAKEGYIVTNFHVVQDAAALEVKLADGRTITDVRLIGYDVLIDLAVLKLNASNLIAAQWGESDDIEVGDWVLAVGNPYGLDGSVTSGILSAKERRGLASRSPYQDFLQTDCAVNPGNSGGPLVDVTGKIIGINTAILGEAFRGISFAIPSKEAKKVYEQLIAGGRVIRGWLGVGLDNLTADQIKELGIEQTGGVLVKRVLPNSPAALSGLRVGDVILQWDGKPIADAMELTLQIARTAIGAKVEAVVLRRDGPQTLTITIGQRPDDANVRQ